jgi:Domain of unknown function (DUF4185)
VAADPCAQTASAAAQNRAQAPQLALGAPVLHTPTGRKPAGADDQAPLPTLGPLPAADPGSAAADPPSSAPKQNRAAILPVVPGPGQPAPNPAQPAPNAAAPQAAAAPAPAAAAAAPSTTIAGWVNGPSSPNNTYQRFGISGADLGILWDNGQTGTNNQVLIAFGDTFGNCSLPDQQWRSNTMFRSSDRDLSNGIDVPNAAQKAEFPVFGDPYASSPIEEGSNLSRQIIDSLRLPITEVTVIPTAGISVGTTQYVNFMSVKQWGNPGQWTTNFSAIAVSTNNGDNWAVNRATIRPAAFNSVPGVSYVSGNQNFQQGAFVRPGDGYLYSFGTPSGRSGSAYVSRVPEGSALDLTKYEYWGKPWWNFFGKASWVRNNPGNASPVISAPVSEMSAQYNTYLKKYVVLYCDGLNNVVMRTAVAPQGPWSSAQTLVTSTQIPGGLYAPFIHPWSSGRDLYYNLSLWSAYSVMLMHTTLP